jgi:hypothetical protein
VLIATKVDLLIAPATIDKRSFDFLKRLHPDFAATRVVCSSKITLGAISFDASAGGNRDYQQAAIT